MTHITVFTTQSSAAAGAQLLVRQLLLCFLSPLPTECTDLVVIPIQQSALIVTQTSSCPETQ